MVLILLEQAELTLRTGGMDAAISSVYGCSAEAVDPYRSRLLHVIDGYRTAFGRTDEI